MRNKSIGDVLINPQGEELTVKKWLPGNGLYVIGKWLLKDSKGTTIQLYTKELAERHYNHK